MKMEKENLVSIIMPSFNTGRFIGETIKSVQRQTYSNWELIIVDDCSTDNTDKIVGKFLADKRIKYLKNEANKGAAISRNLAIREANGRWIAFLDSDDLWKPLKLEKQIQFMEVNEYSFSYTSYEEIDENSNRIGVIVSGPNRITKTGMYNYCWPGCLTVMYDATVLGTIQIEPIEKNNDYAIWLKACKKANCYLLNECLSQYRKRNGSISNHTYKELIVWHYKLFKKCENRNNLECCVLTLRNLFWGVYKKVRYVNRIRE